MTKTWIRAARQQQLTFVTFLTGTLLGSGLATLTASHDNLIGLGLVCGGLLVIWLQVHLVVRRATRAGRRAGGHGIGHELCVLQIHIHRGEIVDGRGKPVDPARLPENLRQLNGSLALRVQVDEKHASLGDLARVVHRCAEDLDRTHHERVSRAN